MGRQMIKISFASQQLCDLKEIPSLLRSNFLTDKMKGLNQKSQTSFIAMMEYHYMHLDENCIVNLIYSLNC